jgi:signal transduction histidine kinase
MDKYCASNLQINLSAENVEDVIEESLRRVSSHSNHQIIVRLPDYPLFALMDAKLISQVLVNLLSNAVKYSDGDLEITLEPDGTVVFANTASGLDAVQVGRLFDRFYTVEHAHHSTGLGLAIARTLVEHMNGKITAQLSEGRLVIRIIFS